MDGKPLVIIPKILLGQSVGVILRVAGDKKLPIIPTPHRKDPRAGADGEELQLRLGSDVPLQHLGVSGVGGLKHIVKAMEQGGVGYQHPVLVNPEELFGQGVFFDTKVIVEPRLGPPANVQGGVDVGAAPRHNLAQLVPVVHLGEVQVLHRCAGDNHAIELPSLHLVEGGIKGGQVVAVRVAGPIARGLKQFHLNLKRRVGELAQKLGLGGNLGGH